MADTKHYSDLRVFGNITAESIEIFGQYSLPSVDGTINQIITTDGAGTASFVDASTLGILTTSNFISGTGTTWQSVGANLRVNVSLSPFSTSNLSEGSNLYFTNERTDDRVNTLIQDGTGISWIYSDGANTLTPTISLSSFDSDDLSEGISNLYYNDEYVDDRVAVLIQDALIGTDPTNPIVWTYIDGLNQLVPIVSLTPFDSDALSEGASNLYYADERVDDRVADLMTDTATITWAYNDGLGTLEATALTGITGIEVLQATAFIGNRPTLNFTNGSNMTWNTSDDVINGHINISLDVALGIDELADTIITSVTAGDVLLWNGINWINTSSDMIGPTVLEDLDDVIFGSPGPAAGDLLFFDGSNWVTGAGGASVTVAANTGLAISNDELSTTYNTIIDDSVESIPVGGADAALASVWKTRSIVEALDAILFPTIPAYMSIPKSVYLNVGSPTGVLEIGTTHTRTLTATFNDGSITNGNGTSGPDLVGGATAYTFEGTGISSTTQIGSTLNAGSIDIVSGSNNWSVLTSHDAGTGLYYDNMLNTGNNLDALRALGNVSDPTSSPTITGVHPFFWMKSATILTPADVVTAIENGNANKEVELSTGTITIPFAAAGEYLAFAYPATSQTKTIWWTSMLDTNTIPGDVFGSETILPVDSFDSYWLNINYKIHTTAGPISQLNPYELRNS